MKITLVIIQRVIGEFALGLQIPEIGGNLFGIARSTHGIIQLFNESASPCLQHSACGFSDARQNIGGHVAAESLRIR